MRILPGISNSNNRHRKDRRDSKCKDRLWRLELRRRLRSSTGISDCNWCSHFRSLFLQCLFFFFCCLILRLKHGLLSLGAGSFLPLFFLMYCTIDDGSLMTLLPNCSIITIKGRSSSCTQAISCMASSSRIDKTMRGISNQTHATRNTHQTNRTVQHI